MKFDISIALVLNVFFWLLVNPANGQVSQVAPEWKAHFKTTPVIEDCVFEREIPASSEFPKGETNLYQFRYQNNAFLFRQIRNLDDIYSNTIPTMDFCSGRFESNCWSIEWTSDTYGKLVLFPNADNIWRKFPKNGTESSVYIGERMLFAALYYGIGELDPATIEWPEATKFAALDVSGHKMVGAVTEVSQGRPTVLEWHFEAAPDKQFRFVLEYKYDLNVGLLYYPNEIRILNKEKEILTIYKILILKDSIKPLGKEYFDPKRYFAKPPVSPHPRISTILFSNNESYTVSEDGHQQKVLPSSMIQHLQNGVPIETHPKLVRFVFLSLFVASVIGLLLTLKKTKPNNKTNEIKDQ
jgi:hypothetical protein